MWNVHQPKRSRWWWTSLGITRTRDLSFFLSFFLSIDDQSERIKEWKNERMKKWTLPPPLHSFEKRPSRWWRRKRWRRPKRRRGRITKNNVREKKNQPIGGWMGKANICSIYISSTKKNWRWAIKFVLNYGREATWTRRDQIEREREWERGA